MDVTLSRRKSILERKRPQLINITDFGVEFWAHLRARKIVTAIDEERMRRLTNSEQAAWFYDNLLKRPERDFDLACQALVETGQQHVACQLWKEGELRSEEVPLHVKILLLMRPDMLDNILLNNDFWTKIREKGVFTGEVIDSVKNSNSTKREKLDNIIDILLEANHDMSDIFISCLEESTKHRLLKAKSYWMNILNPKPTCTFGAQPMAFDAANTDGDHFGKVKWKIANHYKSHRGKIVVWPYGLRLKWENIHSLFTETTCSRKKDIHSKAYGPISCLSSIFENENVRKQTFLQGQPGMGKTTLVNWALTCWAESVLSTFERQHSSSTYPCSNNFGYELVIALSLGQVEPGSTLVETITKQVGLKSNSDDADVLMQFILHYQEQVLFVLDALDEFDLGSSAEVSSLITGGVYGHASRFVTSRHTAAGSQAEALVEGYDTHLELEGFENFGQAERYIGKYFATLDDAERALSLTEEIQAKVNLTSLCRVPLHLHLMCLLWEAGKELGKRKTDLYIRILRYTLDIYTVKKKREKNVKLDDLSDYHDDLLQYGDVALRGLMRKRNRFVFNTSVNSECERNDSVIRDKGCRAGLMLRMEPGYFGDSIERVKFQHLSLQELLAAYVLWKCEDSFRSFLKHVCTLVILHDFRNTIMFLCGFSEERGNEILKHAHNIAKNSKEIPSASQCPYFNPVSWSTGKVNWEAEIYASTNLSCFMAQCLQEYNDKHMCSVSLPGELVLDLSMVSESKAIVDLCRYNKAITILDNIVIKNGSLNRTDLRTLFSNKALLLYKMNGLYLRNLVYIEDTGHLREKMEAMSNMLYLRIDIKENSPKDASNLLKGILNPIYLIRLTIIHLDIRKVKGIFESKMSTMKFLVKLFLGSMNLSFLGERVQILFQSKFLVHILLQDTQFTRDQLEVVFKYLPLRCPNLLELDLSGNDLSGSMIMMSGAVCKLKCLERLLILRCNISAAVLAQLLQSNSKSLWCIDVSENPIELDTVFNQKVTSNLEELIYLFCKGICIQDNESSSFEGMMEDFLPGVTLFLSKDSNPKERKLCDKEVTALHKRMADASVEMSAAWNIVIVCFVLVIHCIVDYHLSPD